MANLEMQEMKRLERTVTDVESLLARSPESRTPLLTTFLQNAKMEIARIEHRQREDERQQSEAQSKLMASAERESALTREEQRQFTGFLREGFFTKNQFSALEHFYTHAYDRLSEDGREAMSCRFWEGIRHNEYAFQEAPAIVREKEELQAYQRLQAKSSKDNISEAISKQDRADFIDAYERGDHAEAQKVLSRPGFKDEMFRGPGSAVRKAVERSSETLDVRDLQTEGTGRANCSLGEGQSDLNLADVDLSGLTLAESDEKIGSARVPTGAAPSPRGPLTRGS